MSRTTMSLAPLRLAQTLAAWLPILAAATAATAATAAPAVIDLAHTPGLTAAQIVERNVAARGGLVAWQNAQTMIWIGHMESVLAPDLRMGFVLAQKRPNKTRFEVNSMSQKTWRVFDGVQGWKSRTDSEGRPDVQAFSPRELRFAQQGVVIDTPLVDADRRGARVELEGEEQIDGRRAYRLLVNPSVGERRHVWVDAQSYLDVRYERVSYTPAGAAVLVTVSCHDFKNFDGLQIPTVVETGSPAKAAPPDRMVIEQVSINTTLDDGIFERAGSGRRARRDDGRAPSLHSAATMPTGAASAGPGGAVP